MAPQSAASKDQHSRFGRVFDKDAVCRDNLNVLQAWANELSESPQDYLVVSDQPWLDGFCVRKGTIRQFVAMPLGEGYTAEEQLTGAAEHGGLQIVVYPMKAAVYEAQHKMECLHDVQFSPPIVYSPATEMGLAPGGLMRQENLRGRIRVRRVGDVGSVPMLPAHPQQCPVPRGVRGRAVYDAPTAAAYTDAGLPWFDYYGGDLNALEGSEKLANLDSVAAKMWKVGAGSLPGNDPVQPTVVKELNRQRVREGEF